MRTVTWGLAGAFVLACGVAFAEPDTPVNPFAGSPAAVEAGRKVFESGCTACHGAGGTGTERAPALDSGRFKHGGEELEILQTIQHGVPGTQMPSFAALKPEQLWQLVSYVRNLSHSATTPAAVPDGGDAGRGEQLFFGQGQCAACHEVNGRGVPLAADLSEIGRRPAGALAAGIEHQPELRRSPFAASTRFVTVTLLDGTPLEGLARSEDSFSVVLQTLTGDYRLLDRAKIRAITRSTRMPVPAELAQHLSVSQRADLVAYLVRQTQRTGALSRGASGPGFDRLAHARKEPQNWLTYWGSYASEHFSPLTQINPRNLSQLQARWALPLPGASPVEATPLVVDGVMYVAGPPGDVYAVDARSGLVLWKFHRAQEKVNPFQLNPYNRGVAVLGPRVFVATLDNVLIALDARSGRVLWEQHIADTMEGYTMTGAPLALDGKIIVGVSGGEMGVRGFIDAYDAASGHRLWRFDTIPGPGEPGHETWSGDSWKTGSGATWLTGSYDPELHLLYWTVGNPGPDFDPSGRQGDNLYTCSVLALDPETGRRVWHYQFSPHDTHDWDSAEDVILAEEPVKGQLRKVLLHADRNGLFYTLDRVTGELLSAMPFVRQTWNKGFAPDGRPLINQDSVATPEGHTVFPSVGGTNFQAPSYDPQHHALFLSFMDSEGFASYQHAQYQRGATYTGMHLAARPASSQEPLQGVMALDTLTGKRLWTFPVPRPTIQAGVLATAGGVVLAGTAEGNVLGLDARSGRALWHFQTGGTILAAPMSYRVEGTQFIAVAAGNMLYSFSLPDTRQGDR